MIDSKTAWLGMGASRPEDAKVCLMGIPFDGGTSLGKGAALAPGRIRQLGEKDMPEASDTWRLLTSQVVYDSGDVVMTGEWESYFAEVEAAALRLMEFGKFNLFLGGDHSVTIPLHRAFKRYIHGHNSNARLGIIHFDAHFDLCDNFDGHKWSHANTEKRALDDIISPGDLAFLGIRAAETEELSIIRENPAIEVISATDVFRQGYAKAYQRLAEKFNGYDALYFTLDIDVLDPAFAPGTGTPVFGGLESRELIELVRLLLTSLPVKAMDIVEVSPPLDHNDITTWAAIRIIQEVFSCRG